jgi:hypothetical protein
VSGSYGQGGLGDVFGHRPDRPTHPDFNRLVNTVLKLDGRMDEGGDFDATIGQYVDQRSIAYMAQQRALRAVMHMGVPPALQTAIAAVWLDGFTIGCDYTKDRRQA